MTPAWAAQELWDLFGAGRAATQMLEPTCGDGRMLACVPAAVQAIGVELDSALVAQARQRTTHQVLEGDILQVLPHLPRPDLVFGNPPFVLKFFEALLHRLHSVMRTGCCGFLLPSYFLQHHTRVSSWMEKWHLRAHQLPRTIFPGLRCPLVFVEFDRQATGASGFWLYGEQQAYMEMPAECQQYLRQHTWRDMVGSALRLLGGTAELQRIYDVLAPGQQGKHWRAKVRQTLQRHFCPRSRGVWTLPS